MKGYPSDTEGTARILTNDGLHTGDLAWMDVVVMDELHKTISGKIRKDGVLRGEG